MDIQALRTEIVSDPLGLGYAGLSDAQVADLLNTENRPGKRAVPAADVRSYILLNGLWPGIQAVADSSANPLHKNTAITVLQTISAGSFDTIRMDRPNIAAAVGQMLSVMIQSGVISEQNRAELIALGDTQISRAEELGLGRVHHLHVAEARNG